MHIDKVYGLCLRMTGNVAEAEDCAQDAFIQAWNKLDKFRGDSALFREGTDDIATRTGWQALPILAVPFIILGGILKGVFTPSESGAAAVVVALLGGLKRSVRQVSRARQDRLWCWRLVSER